MVNSISNEQVANGLSIRNYVTAIAVACLLVQVLFLSETAEDALVATSVTWTIVLSSQLILRRSIIQEAPIPSLMIIFFDISNLAGPLLLKTFLLEPISLNLANPIKTFSSVIACEISGVIALYLYTSLFTRFQSINQRSLLSSVTSHLTRWERNEVYYIIGYIGLLCRVLFGNNSEQAFESDTPVLFRVLEGFTFLMYLPAIIPFKKFFSNNTTQNKFSVSAVVVYFGTLLFVALARNYRAIFMDGIFLVVTLGMLGLLTGRVEFSKRLGRSLIVVAMCAAAAMPLVTRVSVAMVQVRELRNDLSYVELAKATFAVAFDNQTLRAVKARTREQSITTGYSEHYVEGQLSSRLVMTKFHDNVFLYSKNFTDTDRAELLRYTGDRAIGLLPQPAIKLLGLDFEKSDVNNSSGDFVLYLAEGWGLGGKRTGSLVGELFIIFGAFAPFVFFTICIVLFSLYSNLFVKTTLSSLQLSPIGLMLLWRIIGPIGGQGINSESLSMIIGGLLRTTPQSIAIYFVLVFLTKHVINLLPSQTIGRRSGST